MSSAAAAAANLSDDEEPPPPVDTPPKIIPKKNAKTTTTSSKAAANEPSSGGGPSAPLTAENPQQTPIPGFHTLGIGGHHPSGIISNHPTHPRTSFFFNCLPSSHHLLPKPTRRGQQKEKVATMVNDIHQRNATELSARRQNLKQEKMKTRRKVAAAIAAYKSTSTPPQSSQQQSVPTQHGIHATRLEQKRAQEMNKKQAAIIENCRMSNATCLESMRKKSREERFAARRKVVFSSSSSSVSSQINDCAMDCQTTTLQPLGGQQQSVSTSHHTLPLQQHLSAPRPRSKRTDQQNEKVAGMVNDIRQSNAGQLLALRQKLKQQKLTTRRRTQFAAEAVASSSSSSTKTTTTCSEKKEEDAPPPPPVESPPSSPTTTRQQTTQRSSSNVARRCNLWNHSNCFR